MPGNNAIQVLRFHSSDISQANLSSVPLAGQPIYDLDTHMLYVGDGVTDLQNLIKKYSPYSSKVFTINPADWLVNNSVDGTIHAPFYYKINEAEIGRYNVTGAGAPSITLYIREGTTATSNYTYTLVSSEVKVDSSNNIIIYSNNKVDVVALVNGTIASL